MMTTDERREKWQREALRSSVVHVLKLMRDTGEQITFERDRAFLWLEPVPHATVNELIGTLAVAPIGDGPLTLAITKIGREVIGNYYLPAYVKQAIKTGQPFSASGGQIAWLNPSVSIRLKRERNPIHP